MAARRLKAPAGDREVFADPPLDRVPALVEANRKALDRGDVKVGGMPLREMRALARREVLEAAREYTGSDSQPLPGGRGSLDSAPLLLAGHQPELSHPGVWVKHYALNGLAKRAGGIALNLVVDNDTLKSTSLWFPTFTGHDPTTARLESVAFDQFGGAVPYEDRGVLEPRVFRTFAERSTPLWRSWGYEPLLPRIWSEIVEHPAQLIGEKFAAVRRRAEQEWGCRNLELPVSRLAMTHAFEMFMVGILADLPRFVKAYNTAVEDYRLRNHLRSSSHPVPNLATDGEWYEAPFWEWKPGSRRKPVHVRFRGGSVESKDTDPKMLLRPRALTLTLFARLCLGDFFIHGIGGGKYDEVTDAIIRDYFGIEPPAYQVLSATLRLPLPTFPTTAGDVRALERRERDMYWNPQRHVPKPEGERPDVRNQLHRHDVLAAVEPGNRVGRRRRFRELREVGDQLRPLVAPRMAEVNQWITRARQEAAANAVLMRRDYSWVLYPEESLRPFMQGFL